MGTQAMRIHALTVSVDYADHLQHSIPRLAPHLASWTIVTCGRDAATQELVRAHSLGLWITEAFYARGAAFNKGAALQEAFSRFAFGDDWLLLVDADVVPSVDWYQRVSAFGCESGKLYSAWRYQCAGPEDIDNPLCPRVEGDGLGVGYWQLMHLSDPNTMQGIPTCWSHAGVYDCEILHRWSRRDRVELPMRLYHLGDRDNWLGRGKREEFEKLMEERRRRGGTWQHERID